jgi:hypothetical protein
MAVTGKTERSSKLESAAEQLPALTSKAVREHGWQRQAEHLSIAHLAVGMAVMSAAGQSRPSSKRFTHNTQPADAELKRGLATDKIARKIAPRQIPSAHEETSTSQTRGENVAEANGRLSLLSDERDRRDRVIRLRRTSFDPVVDATVHLSGLLIESSAASADRKNPELKGELGAAQEERIHWENESRSLQASLDLLISENSRLSRCLQESAAAASSSRIAELEGELYEARSQLEQKKAALIAADADHNRLAAARNGTNEKQRTEITTLHARLQAESTCAASAEKRVGELADELCVMRQRVVLLEGENRSLQASLAGGDEVRSQLEQKRAALIAADAELNKLAVAFNGTNEKHRIEMNTLHAHLQAESTRAAIAECLLAEARESWLVQIQEYSVAESRAADATTACELANLKLELFENTLRRKERQLKELELLAQRVARLETETSNHTQAQHEFNDRVRQDAGHLPPVQVESQVGSTETLLANTITF